MSTKISNKENTNPIKFNKNDTINANFSKNSQLKLNSSNHNTNKKKRFRRTLSFINQKRKRASQLCSHNANRRLSLNPVKKSKLIRKETLSNSLENSFSNSITFTDEDFIKSKEIFNRRFSNFNPKSSFSSSSSSNSSIISKKSAKFKSLKLKINKKKNNYEETLQLLQKQTVFDIDQRLKDYMMNHLDDSWDFLYEVIKISYLSIKVVNF